MQISFSKKELLEIYLTGKSEKYSKNLIQNYIKKVTLIQEIKNENELRKFKSLHFEKLKGKFNQYSIRLNKQFRLLFDFNKEKTIKIIQINEISKHYQ